MTTSSTLCLLMRLLAHRTYAACGYSSTQISTMVRTAHLWFAHSTRPARTALPTFPVLSPKRARHVQSAMKHAGKLFCAKKYAAAEPLYREVVAECTKYFGEGCRDTIIAATNHGLCLRHLGRHADAFAVHAAVVALSEKTFGAMDALTLTAQNNLAMVLSKQGDNALAEAVLRPLIANSILAYGASDDRTLTSQSNLAKCLKAQGGKAKRSESMRLERSIFKICKRTMAPDSPRLIDALAAIGRTLFFCGHYEKAAQYDRKVLALTKRRFPEESAEIAVAANNLALDLARLNRAAEAETLTRRALRATILVFGHGSGDHEVMVRNLEMVLDDQSKVPETIKVRTMAMTCGA